MSRSKPVVIVLSAFLLIAGLRGACYVTVLNAETGHECCTTATVDDDMANSACCDDYTPSRNDISSAFVAIVIERVFEQDLVSLEVAEREWPETVRPPPRRASATGPVAPRAPPLS